MDNTCEELERRIRITEAILNASDQAILCVDDQRKIIWINRLAARLAGIPQGEAIGMPCTVFAATRHLCPDCGCDRILRNAESRSELVGIQTEEGGRFYWKCETKPLCDSKGRVMGVLRTSRPADGTAEAAGPRPKGRPIRPGKNDRRQRKAVAGEFLSICSSCKDVRDSEQNWHRLESWFGRQLGISFSHSLCPACLKKLYPDFY